MVVGVAVAVAVAVGVAGLPAESGTAGVAGRLPPRRTCMETRRRRLKP